jgi:hypothetical protein
LFGVRGAHPVRGDPRILEWPAARKRVQVRRIRRDALAELAGIADVPMAGDHQPDARHRGQPGQASAVIAQRLVGVRVQQRYLDIGTHVAGHQNAAAGQEHRAVTGSMPIVNDQFRRRARPRDGVRG